MGWAPQNLVGPPLLCLQKYTFECNQLSFLVTSCHSWLQCLESADGMGTPDECGCRDALVPTVGLVPGAAASLPNLLPELPNHRPWGEILEIFRQGRLRKRGAIGCSWRRGSLCGLRVPPCESEVSSVPTRRLWGKEGVSALGFGCWILERGLLFRSETRPV